MIPLRCFTCNNFVGTSWEQFLKNKSGRSEYKDLLDSLGITRICCRRMLLTHVEIIEDTAIYSSTQSCMDEAKTSFDAFVKKTRTISCD